MIKLKNLLISTTITSLVLGGANSTLAATWRSDSGKTMIPNLDTICWGVDRIDVLQTVFGKDIYSGSMTFDYVKTKGCFPGDSLQGIFDLYTQNNRSFCSGIVTINWQKNNTAYIVWDITNSGTNCPVSNKHWEVKTYPVAQKTPPNAKLATVFAPPSNVRSQPNGQTICSLRSVTTINIYGFSNGWYKTDVCGSMGYIHQSQVRF